MAGLFEASYAKVHRAEQFIAELQALQDADRADCLKAITPTHDQLDIPPWGLSAIAPERPYSPGIVVGDAIHNLRAALDLMASELAHINGKRRDRIKFPFSASAAELDNQIAGKEFHLAGHDAVLLLKRIAPYHGGNQQLRNLHDLDIQDKHTALIITLAAYTTSLIYDVPNGVKTFRQGSFKLEAFEYIFPPDSVFAREAVLPTLKGLVQAVKSVLESFALLVASRTP